MKILIFHDQSFLNYYNIIDLEENRTAIHFSSFMSGFRTLSKLLSKTNFKNDRLSAPTTNNLLLEIFLNVKDSSPSSFL